MKKDIKFVNRTESNDDDTDYIKLVNTILENGGTISISDPLYINALNQYNASLKRGDTERLETPEGFCGYINPDSGELRVEPERPVPENIPTPNTTPTPDIQTDIEGAIPYPIDCALKKGLPGSFEYTDTDCGIDDGDNNALGVDWTELSSGFPSEL